MVHHVDEQLSLLLALLISLGSSACGLNGFDRCLLRNFFDLLRQPRDDARSNKIGDRAPSRYSR